MSSYHTALHQILHHWYHTYIYHVPTAYSYIPLYYTPQGASHKAFSRNKTILFSWPGKRNNTGCPTTCTMPLPTKRKQFTGRWHYWRSAYVCGKEMYAVLPLKSSLTRQMECNKVISVQVHVDSSAKLWTHVPHPTPTQWWHKHLTLAFALDTPIPIFTQSSIYPQKKLSQKQVLESHDSSCKMDVTVLSDNAPCSDYQPVDTW